MRWTMKESDSWLLLLLRRCPHHDDDGDGDGVGCNNYCKVVGAGGGVVVLSVAGEVGWVVAVEELGVS